MKGQPVSDSQLRVFGLLLGIFMIVVLKLLLPWWFGLYTGTWPWWAALAVAGFGLAFPARLGLLYRGWMRIGHGIGRLLTPVLLALVYFCVVLPMGGLLRLRRDPMCRRLDPEAKSYRQRSEPLVEDDLERPF